MKHDLKHLKEMQKNSCTRDLGQVYNCSLVKHLDLQERKGVRLYTSHNKRRR